MLPTKRWSWWCRRSGCSTFSASADAENATICGAAHPTTHGLGEKIDRRDLREMRGQQARLLDTLPGLRPFAVRGRRGGIVCHPQRSRLSADQLQEASQFVAATGQMPGIDQDVLNREIASVRAKARSLAKMGLLIAPDGVARKALLVSSVADTTAARFWRSIRLFDIRLYHPDASVPISITAGMFEPTGIVLVSKAFAKSEDCLRCFAEIRRERYDICFVKLDDFEPSNLGIAGAKTHEVQSEFGRKRFLEWLKKLG